MELFEPNTIYSSKEVRTRLKISGPTLDKYCKGGVVFFTLPGSKTRRFKGEDLNNFFAPLLNKQAGEA